MSDFARTRVAIAARLKTDLGVHVYQGPLDAPNTPGQQMACVFSVNRLPADDRHQAQISFAVRAFAKSSGVQQTPETPLDPTDLEDLEEQILVSLRGLQADQTIQDGFFQWMGSEFDHVTRYVEMTFVTWGSSPFTMGG